MNNRRKISSMLIALTIMIGTVVRTPYSVFAEDPRQKSIAAISEEDADESAEKELNMYQFRYNNELVTYNDKIPKSLYPYECSSFSMLQEDRPLHVITNTEGTIRGVYINESGIETFHGIEVGFSENRVFSTFDKVTDIGDGIQFYVYCGEDSNTYTSEELKGWEDPGDRIMCYGYKIENHVITQIYLYDYTYAYFAK